ncbi:hypothetical protein [Gilvibacter sediminis]|uniref:hypothetical protein n=1 Tax=Gilvibacter sediminis TaxID=379071 RepID=UPI0023504AA8|nr:hypothetical protein [Gilvibacter sediminis]MDC7999230.1 hypothetical protein [Gilvibacter sediminis]
MKCRKYLLSGLCVLLFSFNMLGQEDDQQDQPYHVLQGENTYTWVDNSPRAFVTITVPGAEIEPETEVLGFTVDKDYYQLLPRPYESEMYTNASDTIKEIELLNFFKDDEIKYMEAETMNTTLEVTSEIFKNSDGKKFQLWYYPTPKAILDTLSNFETATRYHYHLDFVANDHLYGVYTISYEEEPLEEALARIKGITETIDVFGYYVDLDALSYRLSFNEPEEAMEFVDVRANYALTVPEWLNITRSEYEDVFFASFPDNYNIKNAMSISFYDKEDFKSFKAFNKEKLVGLKMGDNIGRTTVMIKNELEPPENSTGVSYKIQQMAGRAMYEMQYVTYETPTGYLLINFTATPETYDINAPKFREVLEGLSFDIEEAEESDD